MGWGTPLPLFRSGILTPQDATALNRMAQDLYRLVGGFSADPPLVCREDATGVRYGLQGFLGGTSPPSTMTVGIVVVNCPTPDNPAVYDCTIQNYADGSITPTPGNRVWGLAFEQVAGAPPLSSGQPYFAFRLSQTSQVTFTDCTLNASSNGTVGNATVVNGGSGYVLGDLITVAGGIFTTACVLSVTTLQGPLSPGPVTTVSVQNGGNYLARPTNPASQASTSGSGSGATFDLYFRATRDLWFVPGDWLINVDCGLNGLETQNY